MDGAWEMGGCRKLRRRGGGRGTGGDWEVGARCVRYGVMGHGWAEGVAVSGARGQGIRGGRAGGVEGGGKNSGSSE